MIKLNFYFCISSVKYFKYRLLTSREVRFGKNYTLGLADNARGRRQACKKNVFIYFLSLFAGRWPKMKLCKFAILKLGKFS